MIDRIERELELPAEPDQVWEAVTDPTWLEAWLADEVALELRSGGEARFSVGGRIRTGWVEEVCPPSGEADARWPGRLAFWWAQDGEPASRVEIELLPAGSGTRLRVVETRPLEALDLVGIPLPGSAGRTYGPALVAA